MNIINYIHTGESRSVKAWKWVLIIWLSTLLLVSLFVLPVRAGMKSVIGLSMITEKLQNGINLDAIANSGTGLSVFLGFLKSGLFLVVILGFLMNVFYSGGLFSSLKSTESKFTSGNFFSGSGANFWSFLVITIINTLIIIVLALIIIGIPVLIASKSGSEGAPYITFRLTAIAFLLIVPVFLLVTDYARVWQSASPEKAPFRAIGKGFSQTFRHFFSSYFVMLIITLIQLFYTYEVFNIVGGLKPQSGGGIFLLFLLSQALFIIKIFLKALRYGSVTSMYEQHV
jgi:hypothetical protein